MSPTPKRMGKRIQALRKRRTLSRQQLAAKARVSREYTRKLEGGQYDPAGTLRQIAKALGVPLAELLG